MSQDTHIKNTAEILGKMKGRQADGLGAYLGTGAMFNGHVRSEELRLWLEELLAWRAMSKDLAYNPDTGKIQQTGELSKPQV